MSEDFSTQIEELQKYAEIDDSELGEVCIALVSATKNISYVNAAFASALRKEIVKQLTNYRKNSTIVETHITHTHPSRELQWKT